MSGLRKGELIALRPQNLRFMDRRPHITVERQLIQGLPAPPKTPRSRRQVPMPTRLAEELAKHLSVHPELEAGDLLFVTPRDGEPIQGSYWAAFKQAAAKVGVPDACPHDLRHFYASQLVSAGDSILAVAAWLGHANAEMIMRTYGHLLPDADLGPARSSRSGASRRRRRTPRSSARPEKMCPSGATAAPVTTLPRSGAIPNRNKLLVGNHPASGHLSF